MSDRAKAIGDFADIFTPAAAAKRLREQADALDALASAAKRDGDSWDEGECRAKGMKLRRQARRLEHSS